MRHGPGDDLAIDLLRFTLHAPRLSSVRGLAYTQLRRTFRGACVHPSRAQGQEDALRAVAASSTFGKEEFFRSSTGAACGVLLLLGMCVFYVVY